MKYEETRVAIVTGAGSGIGLAIAQTLAKSGHAIVVVDINDRRAEDLAANLRHSGSSALAVHANLSQRDDPFGIVATTLGHYGHVDVLVNNAGIMDGFAPLLDMDEALLSRVMGVNLEGALWASRAALRAMLERGRGVIVNIASIGGFAGGPGWNSVHRFKARADRFDAQRRVAVRSARRALRRHLSRCD